MKKSRLIHIITSTLTFGTLLSLLIGGSAIIHANKIERKTTLALLDREKTRDELIIKQSESMKLLESELGIVKIEGEETQTKINEGLAGIETKLSDKDKEFQTQQSKISSLEKNLTDTKNSLDPDIAQVVSEWEKYVFKVSCSLENDATGSKITRTGSGSGYLIPGNAIRIFTNRHVIEDQEYSATSCTAHLPNLSSSPIEVITAKSNKTYDFAYLTTKQVSNPFTSLPNTMSICPANSSKVGDKILILGYPVTGSSNDVTVTEGITSSIEDDYYVTSAKIEKGNSGGAAVRLRGSCLIGLPTFVKVGDIESLGRILKIDKVINTTTLEPKA
ncbi:MAG: hypothetical protein COU07_03910 [Candidatus Harrisonbacteria bacterium CG10_big_fil_rev_8_21_14_0_10_40_38]|uniref:Serine protease n=1 Tax=Candidatus Harrisonbacteria bacterium CG10_big_fil_rev_8_21_14_0_10_40_38 TaxID=1974583 RepID=A0A2H0URH7_9BACT|nr:MAG: hypothetical protein COU07_03910 [Candidatus Harrisonbacteria bacterium CG10_big_fil_rev_8_21_14_0_10_40_38]